MDEALHGRICGGNSQDSSLAVSPLSTHRTNCESLASTGADSTKPAVSALFAKVDISDLLAPLETRLFERLDAMEAMVERRCGALECRVGVLTAGVAATSDTATHQQIKVLQAQMEATMGQLQSYMDKESARVTGLTEGLKACGEKQACLQSNIDEVWRQLKSDRQEILLTYQNLSDTIEPRLRGILEKVDRRCSDLSGLLEEDTLHTSSQQPVGRMSASPTPRSHDDVAHNIRLSPPGSHTLQSRCEALSPTNNSSMGPLLATPASPQMQHRSTGTVQASSTVPPPSTAQTFPESERVNRLTSTPTLPLRMRSVDVPTTPGGATPSNVARPAQSLQRAPVQRMVSANKAQAFPECSRSGGGLRSQATGPMISRSCKDLPRP
mmetsp:Transcript_72296/g.167537  ORF Transcript_72296/g.167537 Transcript_72296/m.167537 type:complete len:382 (-) Transcript_72296:194-1339(-)